MLIVDLWISHRRKYVRHLINTLITSYMIVFFILHKHQKRSVYINKNLFSSHREITSSFTKPYQPLLFSIRTHIGGSIAGVKGRNGMKPKARKPDTVNLHLQFIIPLHLPSPPPRLSVYKEPS